MSTQGRNRPQSHKPLTFKYIMNMPITLEFKKDQTEVTVHHPGLSYESYSSGNGQPTISSLMNVIFTASAYAFHKPMDESNATFLDFAKLTDDSGEKQFTFIASYEMEMENVMYDSDVIKSPLDVKINIDYIGKTSFSWVSEVTIPSHGATLMKNVSQFVLIDRLTRKPTAFPEWWKEKYSPYTVRNQPFSFQRLVKPDKFFQYKLFIAWSDTDLYNHTNSTSYSRFAIDAIQSASSQNFFKHLSPEKLLLGIKKTQMSFIGESAQGDLVEVCVWEDCEKPMAFCDFLKDGKTIFQCSVLYNIPNNKSHL